MIHDDQGPRRATARTMGGETLAAIRRAVLFAAGAIAILAALAVGGLTLPGERAIDDGLVARLIGTTRSGADERIVLRSLAPTP